MPAVRREQDARRVPVRVWLCKGYCPAADPSVGPPGNSGGSIKAKVALAGRVANRIRNPSSHTLISVV